ncbi:hypothetical protein Vadar_005675 [Vaccinium darrowii]|uniref:Uncharacterized protein n=1 Tax=Vaccinium darrowii TaxID=229202 RepID=A0ACB7XFL0_9ERIC|nr:hypothetical protein Vadar_005675 [Vaccinium darrowii]
MATLVNVSISFLLYAFVVSFYLILCSSNQGFSSHLSMHTIEVTSLLPSSVCSPSTKDHSKSRSLKVVHRHGPCSQLNQDQASAPTMAQILSDDQSRVDSIQHRLSFNEAQNSLRGSKATLPDKSGRSIGSANYIVTVGLGTPKRDLSLIFDTGSGLTWTQCQPCVKCYKQQESIYDPSASKSYTNITCNAPQCSQLTSATGVSPDCDITTCIYGIQYGDSSYSVGFLGSEKLTLTPKDIFPNFIFGCGQINQGLFRGAAGLLGLDRDPFSTVSQTASKYGKYFSYCLPSQSSSTGTLTFGKGGTKSKDIKFTPSPANPKSPLFYFVDITGIIVRGQKLSISESVFKTPGTIIDSGTVITRLQPAAYTALRTSFREALKDYNMTNGASILDTCYDFTNYDTVQIPTISFLFAGGIKVPLDLAGILYGVSLSQGLGLEDVPNYAEADLRREISGKIETFDLLLRFRTGDDEDRSNSDMDHAITRHSKSGALQVVHRNGPCSQLNHDRASAPSTTQIISDDQSRVRSLHHQFDLNLAKKRVPGPRATLPDKSGSSIGSANYIVTVGLGTPKRDLSLIFDTGSGLTWTQCQPCVKCYKQQESTYNPSASKSYKNITCSAPMCSQLTSATGVSPDCVDTTCIYGIQYGDTSFSVGFLGSEKLTLTRNDIFPNFTFGCGKNNQGLFRGAAGLLGLNRDPFSAVSQTASKYGKYFSYCLPSQSSSTGTLTFGKGGTTSKNIKFTPSPVNPKNPQFYFVDINGIIVGGQKLPISESVFKTPGTIIDSGTIPTISFLFAGGVKVPLDLAGILIGSSLSQVCLAFAGNSKASSVGIFGNVQQQTLDVVHDIAGGKIGFGTGGCS